MCDGDDSLCSDLHKKSSKWSKYSKLCIVGIQIRKYILRWTCVYRINFKIRNSKIQANYTAKVKVVRESPIHVHISGCIYCQG